MYNGRLHIKNIFRFMTIERANMADTHQQVVLWASSDIQDGIEQLCIYHGFNGTIIYTWGICIAMFDYTRVQLIYTQFFPAEK